MIEDIIRLQPPGHSLHQALYNSDAAFQRDMDRVFGRHWVLAGHAASAVEVGDWFTAQIGTESIIIVRGRDMQLRAFANVCRHRGSRICLTPSGHSGALVCPYHAWTYNLDGSLRAARSMGADFNRTKFGLKSVGIEVVAGLVFVSLADEKLDFTVAGAAIAAAYTPYGWATAKVAHRETYAINANWKLAVENYLECYHCAPSHPEYSRLHALEKPLDQLTDMQAALEARTAALEIDIPAIDRRLGAASGDAGVFIFRYPLYDGVKTGAAEGLPVAPLMGEFRDYDGGVTSCHFAPSSFFIAYSDYGVIYRFIPISATSAAMELIWLVRGDAVEQVDYDLDKLTWLWRVTSEADKRITEDNQAGVNSRFYEPGPYAPVEPNAIAWMAWYLNEIA